MDLDLSAEHTLLRNTIRDFMQTEVAPVVEERRRNPGEDVLSHLLCAEHEGTRFSDEEVFSHIRLLYAVGASTTSENTNTATPMPNVAHGRRMANASVSR